MAEWMQTWNGRIEHKLEELRNKQREEFKKALEWGAELYKAQEELGLDKQVFYKYIESAWGHGTLDGSMLKVADMAARIRLSQIIPEDYHLSDRECDYLMTHRLREYEDVYRFFLRDDNKEEES